MPLFSPSQLMFFTAVGPLVAAQAAISSESNSGVYNSSQTPLNLPWDTYNYCNAPHVNPRHYNLPANDSEARLVYVNLVMRHHKVRPFSSFMTLPLSITLFSALQITCIPQKIHLTQPQAGIAVILSTRYMVGEPRRSTGRPSSPPGILMPAPSGMGLVMPASSLAKA
jgi:hypothetical protein